MIATLLQIAGLIGLPVAGSLAAGIPGGIVGGSVTMIYVGIAIERER